MMKPLVGKIVHYVGYDPPEGTHLAAIITETYGPDRVDIGLHMFPIPAWAEQIRLQKDSDLAVRGAKADLSHVGYSSQKIPGTWHWPEEE